MEREEIVGRIDYTNLKPNATRGDINQLCLGAFMENYRAVCVNLFRAAQCMELLRGSHVLIAVVIDFPLGAGGQIVKAAHACEAQFRGGHEVDPVINIGAFRDGNMKTVVAEIIALQNILPTKAIIETGYWNNRQIKDLTKLIIDTGAFGIKTSTGLEPKVELDQKLKHIEIIKNEIDKAGSDLLVKAAGGFGTLKDVQSAIAAGADIIGASAKL